MLLKFLSALLILFVPLCINAQPLVKLGKPYKVVDAQNKYYFPIDEEILTVKVNPDEVIISLLNSETMQQTKTFINKKLPRGFSFEDVIALENKFYLFYSVWDKANEKEQLLCQTIDLNTCKIDGNEKLILKVNSRLSGSPMAMFNYFSIGVQDKFDFYYSFDKSKLLITYRIKPEIKRDAINYDVIGMNVFDKDLNKISLQEIKMPHTEKQMDNIDYAVDSDGNAFVLSLVFEDEPVKKDKKLNYFVELLKVKPSSPLITTIPVVLQGKFVNKLWLYETSKNKMVCAGYYNNNKDSDAANGIMMFNVSSDNKISGMINHEIPVEVLNQFVSERTQKKNEKKDEKDKAEFENLELRNLLVQQDGSILLTGEQYYTITTTYYSQSGSRTVTTYYYNDILTCKINADGSLAWMRKLPKRQRGNNGRGTMSYKYMKGEKDHYFLFLDNVKNMKLNLNEFPATHLDGKGGFLTAYKVNDASGVVDKISILDIKDVEGIELYQFSVNRILPISPKEFVFEAYKKGKEDVMLKVTFK